MVTTCLNSQTYKPMLVQNNQWNVLHSYCCAGLGPIENDFNLTEVLKISTDTIIETKKYSKLISAYDSQASIWMLKGFLREDIIARKVYFRAINKDEVLLYNFDVKANDTIETTDFRFDLGNTTVYNIIQSVDSIQIGTVKHKRITITSNFVDAFSSNRGHIWIEGIGGIEGLLTSSLPILTGGEVNNLLCFSQNESVLFKTNLQGYSDCFYWIPVLTSIVKVEGANHLEISPNPVSKMLKLSFKQSIKHDIEIFDMQGRHLISKKSNYGDSEINVSNLSKGTYIVKITNSSGFYDNKLIIKKNNK